VLVSQAAEELGISRVQVWKHIDREHLKAVQLGRFWLIERDELERFKRERRKPGRPKDPTPKPRAT
jgi:excisionase family DNA binding protein